MIQSRSSRRATGHNFPPRQQPRCRLHLPSCAYNRADKLWAGWYGCKPLCLSPLGPVWHQPSGFPCCTLASRGSSGAGRVRGTSRRPLLEALLWAEMDATSLLPFPELSPTQASEGPTSRTLTASVQDGESKLLSHCLQGPPTFPPHSHHPLPLHEALQLSGSEGQSLRDPIIVPTMAKPYPRGSRRAWAALKHRPFPAVPRPVPLPSWAPQGPGLVASQCHGVCGDLLGTAMSFSPSR